MCVLEYAIGLLLAFEFYQSTIIVMKRRQSLKDSKIEGDFLYLCMFVCACVHYDSIQSLDGQMAALKLYKVNLSTKVLDNNSLKGMFSFENHLYLIFAGDHIVRYYFPSLLMIILLQIFLNIPTHPHKNCLHTHLLFHCFENHKFTF